MISFSLSLVVANDLILRCAGAGPGNGATGRKNEGLVLEECKFWFPI
jgi:hypothetical protein